jgi:hypothetical protein
LCLLCLLWLVPNHAIRKSCEGRSSGQWSVRSWK